MLVTDLNSIVEVRDLNAYMVGAKIKNVLIGFTEDKPRIVILTDRQDTDTGLNLCIVVEDFRYCEVAAVEVQDIGATDAP